MSYEDHEITLPPRPPKVAYLIDPLMSRSRTMQDIGEPCRVDGEISGAEVWKWTAKHRIARILGPLAVMALAVAPIGHERTAEAFPPGPAAPARVSEEVTTVVQSCLQRFGYSIAVDGIYGPQTTKAVLHWQKVNGLVEDGIAGPQTLGAIRNAGCGVFVAPVASGGKSNVTKSEGSSATSGKTFNGGGAGADQWHDLAIQVGWTEAQWPTVRCIISRESNGRPEVSNSAGATGLMQILQRYHPGVNLFDPATNLATGLKLYQLRGWQPWHHPTKPCS